MNLYLYSSWGKVTSNIILPEYVILYILTLPYRGRRYI